MQFIPSIEINFCGPDRKEHKRHLRFDLAARRIVRSFYANPELEKSDPAEANKALQRAIDADAEMFLVRAIFALTYHEREDGETPETFERFIGIHNLGYVGEKVREAMGMGKDEDEDDADPITAPNGSVKRSRTGKRSKRSPKSDSESRPNASIQ